MTMRHRPRPHQGFQILEPRKISRKILQLRPLPWGAFCLAYTKAMDTRLKIIAPLVFIIVVAIIFIRAQAPTDTLTQTYSDKAMGFSIRYPSGYISEPLEPSNAMVGGMKFTIPASVAEGTNLGTDTYISVEGRGIPQVAACTADIFFDQEVKVYTITDGNTTYSFASFIGAAAGNRYEESVYALPGTNPCVAVRYLIHYGVFENYLPGIVREFDQAALLAEFDAIRRTLRVVP